MDPLIKSQLLYHLSYAPYYRLCLGRAHLKGHPLALRRFACPAGLAHHSGPYSSRLMRVARLTCAFSTKPSPAIMVSIEVPP